MGRQIVIRFRFAPYQLSDGAYALCCCEHIAHMERKLYMAEMEIGGLEPLTYTLRTYRSPN